jgi:translin
MLTGLEDIVEALREKFDALDKAREEAYVLSRQVVRAASVTIKHAHRQEIAEAQAQLAEARELTHRMLAALADAPELRYGGFVHDSEKEYCEAAMVCAVLTGQPLPAPEELGVYGPAWINGLSEVVGELRRHVLDLVRMERTDEAEKYLEVMDSIYQTIMSFDYPNAISQGLRGRSDAARGLVERTRGDLTNALQTARLERRMKELEGKLGE